MSNEKGRLPERLFQLDHLFLEAIRIVLLDLVGLCCQVVGIFAYLLGLFVRSIVRLVNASRL